MLTLRRHGVCWGDSGWTSYFSRSWRIPVEAPGSIAENTELAMIPATPRGADRGGELMLVSCPQRPTARRKGRRRYQGAVQPSHRVGRWCLELPDYRK